MASVNFIGQTLDGKYKIERELGRGGMGAVYLALHVGTERPVALKIIAPQFMQRAEFVERFRREARAAGRLRHPNVVNVTDFGFAETSTGRVAYLVMEYLDGVTLGEILEEEKHLPVSWTIDILEQVCSAVQEAHQQGIIHRDLKPDNIWLEPNQRGGYTVKVLDFGIAKLEEGMPYDPENISLSVASTSPTRHFQTATVADSVQGDTVVEQQNATAIGDAATVAKTEVGTPLKAFDNDSEAKTVILPSDETDDVDQNSETKVISEQIQTGESLFESPTSSDLTRVGAVLGTPLYMSPEQCRGERLTASSDIYSLAVIAYQMLGGQTPFEGNFTEVMESHKTTEPPPLKAKKVPRRLKKLVTDAMAKNPADRPKDAEAFSTILRARSEGLGSLYRHAITIYGRHLPKFLLISALVFLPVTLLSIVPMIFKLLQYFGMMEIVVLNVIGGISAFLASLAGFFFGAIGFGMVALLIARFLSAPLRSLDLNSAFRAVRQKWKTILGLISFTSILSLFGLVMCFIPGLYLASRFGFVTPAIVVENLRGRAALRRSNELFKRAPWKIIVLTAANFILPIMISTLIMVFIIAIIGNIRSDNQFLRGMGARKTIDTIIKERDEKKANGVQEPKDNNNFKIQSGTESAPNITFGPDDSDEVSSKEEHERLSEQDKFARAGGQSLRDLLFQLTWFPVAILITSFTQVLMALMYVKTRQAGGESMNELLEQFEESERSQSKWQKRVRERLIQSGRISKP